jgi:predicted  nucleic acid-binding Zn-ribbon protein
LVAFNASQYSGSLEQGEDTRELLRDIQEVESNINDIISKIKKETDIRDKVNLNIELKKLNEKLENLKTRLQG